MAHSLQIVFACDNPDRLAGFWAEALGYIIQPPPPGFDSWDDFGESIGMPPERRHDLSAVVDPSGVGPRLFFEKWEVGGPSQRVHLDVNSVGDRAPDSDEDRRRLLDEERVRFEALGATFQREATGAAGETWIEMHDPEGNFFCVQ